MREVLFKAKRLDGEWVEGYPVYDRADCTLKKQGKCQCAHDGSLITFFGGIDNLHEYDEVEVDPSTVYQYTGLTDKDGKKIFEGDILNENGEHFTVVYDSNWAKFKLQYLHAIQYPEWNRGVLMEVVGSIHDGEGDYVQRG